MKEMKFSIGVVSVSGKVVVTNKQNTVEYKVLEGYASESDIRSKVGNTHRDMYDSNFSGYYMDRKVATERLERDIASTEKKLEELKFCLKVTKKKNWVKVD